MNNIISSNFLNENFFIIDSNNIDHVCSKIYGFIITDTGIFNNSNFKQYNNIQLGSSGVYIIITRKKNSIEIYQDFNGSFGLHLYRNKEYFARIDWDKKSWERHVKAFMEDAFRAHDLQFEKGTGGVRIIEDLSVAASTIYRVLEIMKSLDITAYKEKRKEKEENE